MTLKILGTDDSRHDCECCGRNDLKAVTVLQDSDGRFYYYGSECAAKAAGRSATEIRREARQADSAKINEAAAEASRLRHAEADRYHAWLRATTGKVEILDAFDALGGLRAAQDAYAAAMARD